MLAYTRGYLKEIA